MQACSSQRRHPPKLPSTSCFTSYPAFAFCSTNSRCFPTGAAILAAEAAEAQQHHLLEERLPPLREKPHVGDPAPALLRAETDKQAGGQGDGSETEDEEAPSASVKVGEACV